MFFLPVFFQFFCCYYFHLIYAYLFLLQMTLRGLIFALIVVAIVVRTSTPIKRGCAPTGFRQFEPLISYNEAEDTGLLGLYVLYTPKKPKKLQRMEKYWRTRSLILILLLMSGIETNPGEFLFLFIYYALFRITTPSFEHLENALDYFYSYYLPSRQRRNDL